MCYNLEYSIHYTSDLDIPAVIWNVTPTSFDVYLFSLIKGQKIKKNKERKKQI